MKVEHFVFFFQNEQFPKPPAVIFMIDVSYNNMKSGLVHLVCSQMKEILQNLPREQGADKSNMKVGFVTYNYSVHFYNVKVSLLYYSLTHNVVFTITYLSSPRTQIK